MDIEFAGQRRPLESESPSTASPAEPAPKRPCFSETGVSYTTNAIDHWRRSGSWPYEYFKPDAMSNIFVKPALRRKRSEAGSLASTSIQSDSCFMEDRSAEYKDSRYDALLQMHGVYMGRPTTAIRPTSKEWCNTLLHTEATVPDGSVFEDSSFDKLYDRFRGRNESIITREIARLLVPSAEYLYIRGAEDMAHLIASVDEGWNNSLPLTRPRPQPDYSVGFNREAFSACQHERLTPYVGAWPNNLRSYFMGTWYMYFPFLASEVKRNSVGLEVAERQNAHSMALAVRAVVNLYREVGRAAELDREILAFSISHDSLSVRIHGYFPVIDDEDVKYYRYSIDRYDLDTCEGEKRWTAYRFVTNVYRLWAPKHLERLHSAIDELGREKNCRSARGTPESGSSQGLSTQLGASLAAVEPTGDISGNVETGPPTPDTSLSEQAPSKRQRA